MQPRIKRIYFFYLFTLFNASLNLAFASDSFNAKLASLSPQQVCQPLATPQEAKSPSHIARPANDSFQAKEAGRAVDLLFTAFKLEDEGNFEEARLYFLEAAHRYDDTRAKYHAAYYFYNGLGGIQNSRLARRYAYQGASRGGDAAYRLYDKIKMEKMSSRQSPVEAKAKEEEIGRLVVKKRRHPQVDQKNSQKTDKILIEAGQPLRKQVEKRDRAHRRAKNEIQSTEKPLVN